MAATGRSSDGRWGELPLVSIVVPAFNEAEGLPLLLVVLDEVLSPLESRYRFEILVVDDGSQDGTPEVMREACTHDRRLRYLKLARNFGHQAALTAGFEHARGACVVTLDADLQHPPTLLPAMVDAWQRGADVVDTRRRVTPGVGLFKGLTSRLFYRLLPLITGLQIGEGASDFRLLDRQVVEVLVRLPERRRFYRGLVPWLGFGRVTLEFEAGERLNGVTRYSLRKMLRLAGDGVFGFTELPLRVAFFAGMAGIVFGAFYGVWVLFQTLVNHATLPGWTSLLVTVILFGSLNLFVLGILGEYLGRIHEQSKGRPIYVVDRRESVGADPENGGGRETTMGASGRTDERESVFADGRALTSTPESGLPLPDQAHDQTRPAEGVMAGQVLAGPDAATATTCPSPDGGRGRGSWLWRHVPTGVMLTLLTLLAEGRNATRVGFLSDDLMVMAYCRHGDAGAFNPVFWMHRPFGLTFQWLVFQLFGYSAPAHQLAILVVHLIGGLLVYALCFTLSRGDRLWSALAAALFLVFPLDETVPWVSFAPQRLAMVMWLIGTLLLLRRGRRLRTLTSLLAMAAFVFAVLTNEMYLSLTVLTGLVVLLWKPAWPGGRRPWLTALGAGTVVVGYFVWRFAVAPRFTTAVDWRVGHLVFDPLHWLSQALEGFKVPLATVWAFGNSPDSFGLAADGWLPVVTMALIVAVILAAGIWHLSRGPDGWGGLRPAVGRIIGGLVLMGFAMLPFLPTRSDLKYFMLTATRNHYTINLGASVVLVSLMLLVAALGTRSLRLPHHWTGLLFGALCGPPLVLGVLTHRRVARELGEVSDAQRHLACAMWRAAPSLTSDSYVFLRGIGIYPCPLQPLDAEWTVTGLVQLIYEDRSLGGTVYVNGAITDEAMGPLAIAPPESEQVGRMLSRLAILRYTDQGFVFTRRLPAVFVRRGLPEKPGSSAWIGRRRKPSVFVEQYLCGCAEGSWPSPRLSAERPDDLAMIGVFEPEKGMLLLDEAGALWEGPLRTVAGGPGAQPIAGDWTGSGVDSVGVFEDGVFTLFEPVGAPGEEPEVLLTFHFGCPGDLALTGDWDGDGVDTVAVFRDGVFYYLGSGGSSVASGELRFGGEGDIPLAGDWDGDGVDTVGVFRGGTVLLAESNADARVSRRFRFGELADLPVVGDWNGDGVDTLALKRDGSVLFWDAALGGCAAHRLESLPPGLPVAGNWDSD